VELVLGPAQINTSIGIYGMKGGFNASCGKWPLFPWPGGRVEIGKILVASEATARTMFDARAHRAGKSRHLAVRRPAGSHHAVRTQKILRDTGQAISAR
jgi:hypothetical protein